METGIYKIKGRTRMQTTNRGERTMMKRWHIGESVEANMTEMIIGQGFQDENGDTIDFAACVNFGFAVKELGEEMVHVKKKSPITKEVTAISLSKAELIIMLGFFE